MCKKVECAEAIMYITTSSQVIVNNPGDSFKTKDHRNNQKKGFSTFVEEADHDESHKSNKNQKHVND